MVPYLLERVLKYVTLGLYGVYRGYIRVPHLRAHIKGPRNYPKKVPGNSERIGCWGVVSSKPIGSDVNRTLAESMWVHG